ncbi:MAG TPA: hypothetical protein VJ770_04500 [Stellaceae bacterium]|nr:hypothetical protein [Stellaceae bacterium]
MATRIKPGTKPWNAFMPDMTEAEKEAIRKRIRAGQPKTWRSSRQGSRPSKAAEHGRAIPLNRERNALLAQGQRQAGKLTEESVRQIRSLYKDSYMQKEIAQKFGISQPAISKIIHNKIWVL